MKKINYCFSSVSDPSLFRLYKFTGGETSWPYLRGRLQEYALHGWEKIHIETTREISPGDFYIVGKRESANNAMQYSLFYMAENCLFEIYANRKDELKLVDELAESKCFLTTGILSHLERIRVAIMRNNIAPGSLYGAQFRLAAPPT